jgi:hypothetical protein
LNVKPAIYRGTATLSAPHKITLRGFMRNIAFAERNDRKTGSAPWSGAAGVSAAGPRPAGGLDKTFFKTGELISKVAFHEKA